MAGPITAASACVVTSTWPSDAPDVIARIRRDFGTAELSLVALFVSPRVDFAALNAKAVAAFPSSRVIACTTAGEIGTAGYTEGEIVAIGFPRAHFAAETVLLPDLDRLDRQGLIADMIRRRAALAAERPDFSHEFGFLLVDGLSMREDPVAAACADALGPVPLFGGSTGDDIRFQQTAIAIDGEVHLNAAVLTYFRSDCVVKVFSVCHLNPTEQRMVVTRADPSRRIVQEINGEPAAQEYARILGKDPGQLDTFTFAAYPVTVRFGGTHHVRSIQRVSGDGELIFFSAIEEGLVLTLARAEDMSTHLERELAALSAERQPQTIFACDCLLRRLEAQQKQLTGEISGILARHGVTGFSTYGEQLGGMHVNQTMTGVAIYPPDGS